MTVRVSVDRFLCEGHALCLTYAPEVFDLDETEHAVVTNATPPADLVPSAQDAQVHCPTRAIRVEDDEVS